MAPEILRHDCYHGQKVDVFAMGVILFIMVRGTLPFKEATSNDSYYYNIINGDLKAYFQSVRAQHFSPELKDLISKMLHVHPDSRLSVEAIKSHEWMKLPAGNTERAYL